MTIIQPLRINIDVAQGLWYPHPKPTGHNSLSSSLLSMELLPTIPQFYHVLHTTQGLQYPGVQDPEQGGPGARWTVPPEVPLCAVQVHPAMGISNDMWRQDLQRLLSICVSKHKKIVSFRHF